jgi:replicative DNA helicase
MWLYKLGSCREARPLQPITFIDYLHPSFQELVLGLLARDVEFMSRARAILKPEYFAVNVYKHISEVLLEYYAKYFKIPSKEILIIAVTKDLPDRETQDGYVQVIEKLYALTDDDLDRDYIEEQLVAFAQRAEAATQVAVAWKNLKEFDIEQISRKFTNILQITSTFADIGLSAVKDWLEVLKPDTTRVFKTGIEGFDRALRGGSREGELIVIMGPPKRGKSTFLSNIATGYYEQGEVVAVYSLELYAQAYLRRIIANLADVPKNQIVDFGASVRDMMTNVMPALTKGDIIVKEFPPRLTGVEMIDAHLDILEATYKRKVIPVIDYADLLKWPSGFGEEWSALPEIYVALRAMARRRGVPVITASQTGVEGFKAEKLDERMSAGAKRKAFAVDGMFGIEQNDADYKANRCRLVSFLMREERKDHVIFFKTDLDKCKLEEITQEEYESMNPSGDFSRKESSLSRVSKLSSRQDETPII